MNKSKKIVCLSAFFIGSLWPGAAVAETIYTVAANTSSISGQSGYLDLQFEPTPGTTNPATASVTGFTTNGTLNGAATIMGDVTGQLPATLNFDNQTVFNDYFQAITFGSSETFTVTLNGPTPQGGPASAFNIGFYAADGSTPLLTNSPDGNAGQIVLDGDGTTSVTTYPTATSGPSVLTISPQVVASPEPSAMGLIGVSLGLACLLRRRH